MQRRVLLLLQGNTMIKKMGRAGWSPWITIAFGVLCFILGLRSLGVAFPGRRLIVSMLR